jgi:hypothetical protein
MFTLQVRKLFRKTLAFWPATPQPKRRSTRLGLEELEDCTLPSTSSLPVVSSQAESPLAVATSSMFELVEQRVQQIATLVQYASNVVNTLRWDLLQELAAFNQQAARLLGIDPISPNPSQSTTATKPRNTMYHNTPDPSAHDPRPPSPSSGGG